MQPNIATIVIYGVMAMGGLVWLAAVRSLQRMVSLEPKISDQALLPQSCEQVQRSILKTALHQCPNSGGAGVHLLDDGPDRLIFQLAGGGVVSFRFQEDYQGTHVNGSIDLSKTKQTYRYVMTGLVWFAMPIVIFGLGFLLLQFVASHSSMAVRWQAVQVVQIAHVLWPPFLVSKLFQWRVTQVVGFMKTVLASASLAENVSPV